MASRPAAQDGSSRHNIQDLEGRTACIHNRSMNCVPAYAGQHLSLASYPYVEHVRTCTEGLKPWSRLEGRLSNDWRLSNEPSRVRLMLVAAAS